MTGKRVNATPPIEATATGEANTFLAGFKSSLSKRWSVTGMATLYEIADLVAFLHSLGRNKEAMAVAVSVVTAAPTPPPLAGGGCNYNIFGVLPRCPTRSSCIWHPGTSAREPRPRVPPWSTTRGLHAIIRRTSQIVSLMPKATQPMSTEETHEGSAAGNGRGISLQPFCIRFLRMRVTARSCFIGNGPMVW